MPKAITIENVRFSYATLFQPKPPFNNPTGDPKFSVTVLVPKTNVTAKALIDHAINAALEEGVSTKWNGVMPPQPAISVHDGDGSRPSDGSAFGPECRGMWVFTATCKADRPPFVVDGQVQPIIDPTQVYSGMWGNVSVTFFPYTNSGKKGVGCGLNGVQKVRDDTPLGNTVTAQDAFKAVAPQDPAMSAGPAYGAPVAPQPSPTAQAYQQAAQQAQFQGQFQGQVPDYTQGYAAPQAGGFGGFDPNQVW